MKLTPDQMLMAPRYYAEMQAYLRSLPLEHFMEATSQATQRKITLASLELVAARRPEVQIFNELLIQSPRPRGRKIDKVVPDNMVVLWHEPIIAEGSYDLPLQPTLPFWVLEYVSKSNTRKDYESNVTRYENLRIPYYLTFYPDTLDLTLRRLGTNQQYVGVLEKAHGRLEVPELEIEVALLDDWARFWYQGQLLPLPGELLRQYDAEKQRTKIEQQRADSEKQRADSEKQRADAAERELELLREQLRQRATPPHSGNGHAASGSVDL